VNETIPPTEPNQTEEALRLVLVDQSRDAHDEARDAADARLDQELGEGGRTKRFLNGIWKGNVAKDFYRQKYVNQALESIQDSNTIMADAPAERRTRAVEATIERFQSDFDEVIHTEAGESREVQAEDSQLTRGIKKIIHNFVEGNLDAATLQEERTRFLIEYRKQHGTESLGQGIVTTDNLLQIAQTVAGAVEHGESLDNALGKLQVITGEARNGARTEARYTAPDKAVDWLSKRGIASFVTPGALAVGIAAAASLARVGSHSVVGAVTKTILPGAAAAGWAGLRENKRTKDERSQHAREMAVGGQFEAGDKRRVEMDAVRYESISAVDLIGHLKEVGDSERVTSGSSEAVQAALDALAAIQARVQMSDKEKIDLISYSEKADVGEERMMLDLARREVRLALEAGLTNDIRTNLAIDHDKAVSDVIQERADWFAEGLEEEMSDKDAAFNKLKRHRVAKAAAIGLATGVLGGLIVQEAVAAVDSTRFGLIDTIRGESAVPNSDGTVHQTILEGMVRGDESTVHTDASTSYESYSTGTNGTVELSDDHTLITNEDGTSSLVDANGNASVEGLVFEENGALNGESIDKLYAAGVTIEDTTSLKVVTETVNQDVSTEQYLQNHLSESTHVKRDFWFGNNTPNIYDENELRVYRGGSAKAPGIVDGGYQYSIAGMSPEGSYQGPESVDWNQASANGNLFVAISGTLDGQGEPFMVPIGPDGSVNISADSPAGKFFSNENNAVSFNGAYMEVVQTSGQDADGTVHIRPLATVIGGNNVETITDTVTTEKPVNYPHYTLTTNGFDTAQSNFTEMAPITPIASRRSMEALQNDAERTYGSNGETATSPEAQNNAEATNYGYEAQLNPEKLQSWESERSEKLRNNPNAELQTAEEVNGYYERQRIKKGEEYVAEIEARIEQSEVLKKIGTDSRAIVVMPVGAAQESENIYKALSLYAQQDEEAQRSTTVLMNVNWIEGAMDDPLKRANIEKTFSEIERAKADFPSLNIAHFTKVWEREWVDTVRVDSNGRGGKIYGEVIKTLYDTAAYSVRRGINEGRIAPDQDLLLITNDADQLGMNRHYLKHYIEAEEKSKDSDAFIGTIRWGVDTAKDFPGYHVSQLFMQAMNIAATRPTGHALAPATIGPNAAFRVSTYAAVGGCDDRNDLGAGADSVLGRKILAARGRLPIKGSSYGVAGVNATTTYSGSSVGPGSRERVIRQVIGSDVDSAPGRLLDSGYRSEKFIPYSWSDFDSGSTRETDKGNPNLIKKEDPKNDFEPIKGRVEGQITDFINQWYPDAPTASLTLSMMFPDKPELGAKAQAWSLKKDSEDKYTFAFTPDGARRFQNSLLRDGKSRFDPISNRILRRTYGEVKPTAKRQPQAEQPPLVRAVA
jgi:hypothetical protein